MKEIDWMVLAESDSERMLTRTLTSLQRGFHLDKKLVLQLKQHISIKTILAIAFFVYSYSPASFSFLSMKKMMWIANY